MGYLWDYLIVSLLSSFKFIAGVLYCTVDGFGFWEMVLVPTLGGTIGVLVYSYFGEKIQAILAAWRSRRGAKKRSFNFKRAKRLYKIWKRVGLVGIAFLTPPVLTPPVGVAVAIAFRATRFNIVLHMFISFLCWSMFLAWITKEGIDVGGLWNQLWGG